MVAVPADTPVTEPDELIAPRDELDEDHQPPVVAFVNAIDSPIFTVEAPVMVPADGTEFTDTVLVAVLTQPFAAVPDTV